MFLLEFCSFFSHYSPFVNKQMKRWVHPCSRLDKVKLMETTDARANEISEGSKRNSLTCPLHIHSNKLRELCSVEAWLRGKAELSSFVDP